MMGHSLGAAGAIEAVISILALQHQFLPPNINFRTAIPRSAQPCRKRSARCPIRAVLSNSFGFGGTNASVIIAKSGMSLAIRGMGWVTPLGDEIDEVWQRLLAGEEATVRDRFRSDQRSHLSRLSRFANVTPAHPRLRRSSAISRFAVGAGLSALRNAGVDSAKECLAHRIDFCDLQWRSHLHETFLSRYRRPPARRPPVRSFSRKLFSTRQPVISPRSSASPAPVTLWLVMALSGFSRCKWRTISWQ